MAVTAKVKFLPVSPWKLRRYARAFVGKDIESARAFLSFHPSPTCKSLLKLLESAVANAENNFELDPSLLIVNRVLIDGGPKYKRIQPVMRGMAHRIAKPTSHVTIELDFPRALKKELRLKGEEAEGEVAPKAKARAVKKEGILKEAKKPAKAEAKRSTRSASTARPRKTVKGASKEEVQEEAQRGRALKKTQLTKKTGEK